MLTAHGLSKSYSLSSLLNQITFSINAGERVGLIGPNGSGKTTLLRLLAGIEQPDSGVVMRTPADLRVSYLAQGFEPVPEQTLGDLLHGWVGDPARLEDELAGAADALSASPSDLALQMEFQSVLDRMADADTGRTQNILSELGLDTLDLDEPASNLSGGQKTRLGLALVLLQSPELLLLDEPTNHLDIEMASWLEEWLANFAGAALIVSHDRAFLDRTAERIIELDPVSGTICEYSGNYTDYLEQVSRQTEKRWSAWRDQEVEIQRMKQDINRMSEQANHVERTTKPNQPHVRRLAKKVARKAKSREKKLDRYLDSDDRVEKPPQAWQMKLEFERDVHIGRDVITLQDLSVGYALHEPVLVGLNQRIQAGQRVVIIGLNGAGKTTLLRTIAGTLPALQGHVRLGGSVKLGYMSQEQELLDPLSTPLATISGAAEFSETEARSFLHYFLFEGDEALRPNRFLSYGERARLSLARLVAEGSTFLLLDEPINHLDISSRTRFEQALSQFSGTILAVVHDRYFIERFATDVWTVKEGTLVSEVWESLA